MPSFDIDVDTALRYPQGRHKGRALVVDEGAQREKVRYKVDETGIRIPMDTMLGPKYNAERDNFTWRQQQDWASMPVNPASTPIASDAMRLGKNTRLDKYVNGTTGKRVVKRI